MQYRIIVDSCCDLTAQLKEKLAITSVPLIMRLGSQEYVDDEKLNLEGFMAAMKACKERVGSAAPAPQLFQKAMEDMKNSFVVTISSKLSGSHASALVGKALAEGNGKAETHIFDSKTAAAGQTLIALKLQRLMQEGLPKEQIIQTVTQFIEDMKTYFVLENYDNLQKNGRLSKITGRLANILHIKLLMGADENGDIALYAKPRGVNQMVEKMLSLIKDSGRSSQGGDIVISHCNNPGLAARLANEVKSRFHFSDVHIVPTGGLSSLYADDQGVIVSF